MTTTTAQLGDAITDMALRLAESERARDTRAADRRFRCVQRLTAALVARAATKS